MYQIILLQEAKADIVEARAYYKLILKGLEIRFKIDLSRIIDQLQTAPHIYGFRFEGFRTANLTIFPYQVHFKIDEENKKVFIFAILHSYRNPAFIKTRNT